MTLENIYDTLGEAKLALMEDGDIEKALSILERMSEELSRLQEETGNKIKDLKSLFD